MKITKFRDIPQFINSGSWECDYDLRRFIANIKAWEDDPYDNLQMNPDFQRGHVWSDK